MRRVHAGRDPSPRGSTSRWPTRSARLEETAGKRFGDDEDPLLVSVRSGARESMPGMLDTILNVGLNDQLGARAGRAPPTTSASPGTPTGGSCRCSATSSTASRASGSRTRSRPPSEDAGVDTDAELSADALKELVEEFKGFYDFPQDPQEQLRRAIRAVFDSWTGERAVSYRRINRIPDDWGTAVNVQQMVFGNKGDSSATGVAFSRDEVTGAPEPSGDFLVNAQGEDVVSGVRTPRDISELAEVMPEAHEQLMEILRTLEAEYKDMQDVEFTVEEGQLYMLQTRNAKRPAQAAVRFAVDAVYEGLLTREEALRDDRRRRRWTRCCIRRSTAATATGARAGRRGLARARPPARSCSPPPTRSRQAAAGKDVILVRPFTEADDVAGFHAAKGILTSEGGKASHAALVARGMGVPAVTGAAVAIDLDAGELTIDGRVFKAGDEIGDRRLRGHGRRARREADPARDRRAVRHRARVGGRAPPARACASTPTRRATRGGRASSAPRASGCAGPSTCSWPRTASRRCGR